MSEDTLDKIGHIAVVGITPTLIVTRVAVIIDKLATVRIGLALPSITAARKLASSSSSLMVASFTTARVWSRCWPPLAQFALPALL